MAFQGSDEMNITTGTVIRSYTTSSGATLVDTIFNAMPIVNGTMYSAQPPNNGYIYNISGTVTGIDIATGNTVLVSEGFPVNAQFEWEQQMAADGKFFVGTYNPDMGVSAVDLTTGKILWTFPTLDLPMGYCYANGVLYELDYAGNLWALNATTGQLLWLFSIGGSFAACCPAISGNGLLYVGGADGVFYCLNATTGAEVWKYQTHGPIASCPSIADGVVYVASDDGFLYAFADNQSLAAAGVSQLAYGPSVAADASQSSTTPSTTAMSQAVTTKPISPTSPASASWPITAYVAVAAAVAVAVVAAVVAATVVLRRSKRK
jgi:outer membrane protein assembly factor BamB